MIIDVKAPIHCDIHRKVKKLTLTAENQDECMRLRNLWYAIIGKLEFQYVGPTGLPMSEEQVNQSIGDIDE
jgi:hypothetical protein